MRNILHIFALIALLSFESKAQVVTPFTKRFQVTQKGGIVYLANVATGCSSNPQTSGGSCQTGSTAVAPAGTANNNDFNQVYVDVDGDVSTFQSSSDSLALPNCSQITWAGLYWGAMGNAATTPTRNNIKIKANNGAYQNISADNSQLNTTGYTSYHNFKDITSIVTAAGTNARFTVANVPFVNNGSSNNWGSWTIVVVYGNQLQNMRQLTVFDGLANVSGSNVVNVPVSGFLTPPTGPVNFELGTYVHDGDRGLTGDQLLFSGNGGPFINISDAMNTSTNVFNSTVSNNGVATPYRKPFLGNTMGLDADIFHPNNSTKNYLGNSNTNATLKLTTGGETYLVQEISTAIDVYEPDLRVDKKVRDRFGVDKYLGSVAPGDTLEYTITVYNIGSDTSINTFVTDSLVGTAKYVAGSAKITHGPNTGSKTDASADDQVDYNIATHKFTFRVGTGANGSTGGKVANSATGVDSTVIKFKITAETDCFILKCDDVVRNRAYAHSTGLISGNMITTGSNPAAFDGFGCPISGSTDTYINVSLASCVFPPDTTIANVCPMTQTFASLYTRPGYTNFYNSSFNSVITASTPGTYYAVRTASTGCKDTVAITVNTTNCTAPTIVNDSVTTPINTPVSGNMGSNNYFPSGYTTHFNTIPVVNPSHGSFSINAAGNYTYTPNNGYSGNDLVVVQFCGTPPVPGPDVCSNDTLFIKVLPNIITNNDFAVTTQDVPVSGNLNTNNSDPSGTTLTVNTNPVKSPSNGVVSIGSNGAYTYTPNPGFIGKDTVVVTVCNGTTPQMCKTDTLFLNVIAGFGSIGNYVWNDANGDGLQNEPSSNGINGVTVQLYNATTNALVATTVTANSLGNPGYYIFNNVAAGDYYVKFPTSYSGSGLTIANQADMVDGNSDANTSTGNSGTITINPALSGQDKDNTTVDAGYHCNLTTPSISAGGSTTICIGSSVLLTSSSASGNQWYLNGVAIVGATNQTYSASAPGTYTVVYTVGTCSSAASNSIVLAVSSAATPTIATPDGTNVCIGGSIQLCPAVWGYSNYQWYLNGVAIAAPNGTSSCLTVTAAGSYSLAASNGSGCWSAQSAATVVTAGGACSVSSGGGGGVETKSLGDVISKRLYGYALTSKSTEVNYATANHFNHNSGAVVNGANNLTLADIIPSSALNTTNIFVTTPTDLINITNALEVLAVDYTDNNVTKAVAFGTKTLGGIYEHTKPICDRLKAAELKSVSTLNVNGFNLLVYKIIQHTGQIEYAINLSAGVNSNNNNISLQSNWFTDNYQPSEKLFNFQLWAVDVATVKSLAQDIINKLQQNGTVIGIAPKDMPNTFVEKGRRRNDQMELTIQNNTAQTTGYFSIKEKANENAIETYRQVPFTLNASATTQVKVPVADYYESSIYMYLNGKLVDLVYLSDGTWNIDYDKNTTTVNGFNIENDANVVVNANELNVMRNVSVQASVKNYISIYKTINGGGLEEDLRNYNTLKFNTNLQGVSSIMITFVKKSITDWSNQYSIEIQPSSNGQYIVNLNNLKAPGVTGVDLNDVVAINFALINKSGGVANINASLSNLRFTNETINANVIELDQTIAIKPNPTNGLFTATFNANADMPLQLSITEVSTGRKVSQQMVNAKKGVNKVTVSLDKNINLMNGVYVVTLDGDSIKYTPAKLVISKD